MASDTFPHFLKIMSAALTFMLQQQYVQNQRSKGNYDTVIPVTISERKISLALTFGVETNPEVGKETSRGG